MKLNPKLNGALVVVDCVKMGCVVFTVVIVATFGNLVVVVEKMVGKGSFTVVVRISVLRGGSRSNIG